MENGNVKKIKLTTFIIAVAVLSVLVLAIGIYGLYINFKYNELTKKEGKIEELQCVIEEQNKTIDKLNDELTEYKSNENIVTNDTNNSGIKINLTCNRTPTIVDSEEENTDNSTSNYAMIFVSTDYLKENDIESIEYLSAKDTYSKCDLSTLSSGTIRANSVYVDDNNKSSFKINTKNKETGETKTETFAIKGKVVC